VNEVLLLPKTPGQYLKHSQAEKWYQLYGQILPVFELLPVFEKQF
jgi:hypothetical protein